MRTYRRDMPEYLTLTVTETRGEALAGATFGIGLSPALTLPPTAWLTPDVVDIAGATATIKYLMDDRVTTPGVHCVWARVTDTPEDIARAVNTARVEVL